jgi:hypothetical protein
MNKHSSLFSVSGEEKVFIRVQPEPHVYDVPGGHVIKLFTAVIYNWTNKLECFPLTNMSILILYLRVIPEATLVKHL